jgi:hypothetical protein
MHIIFLNVAINFFWVSYTLMFYIFIFDDFGAQFLTVLALVVVELFGF